MKMYSMNLSMLAPIFDKVEIKQGVAYPFRFKCKTCALFIQSKIPDPFGYVSAKFGEKWGKSDKSKYANGIVIMVGENDHNLDSAILYTEGAKGIPYIDADSVSGEKIIFFSAIETKPRHYLVVFVTKD